MAGGPVEVWLTQRNLAVRCRMYREDESGTERSVRSLSMRGAQRELTTQLVLEGYVPAGRWETATANAAGAETMRRFRVAS